MVWEDLPVSSRTEGSRPWVEGSESEVGLASGRWRKVGLVVAEFCEKARVGPGDGGEMKELMDDSRAKMLGLGGELWILEIFWGRRLKESG